MVLFNHSTHELTAKIVYYGPGLCGKTTNLRLLHERLEKGTAGRLLSLATAQDRTIYFDLLPVELGNIKGYTVRFQLCTVPGQVFYNETRKLVLRGVDGVVFVVDSQWSMLSHNLESFQNLAENLRDLSIGIESIPIVVQYNKRDLPGVLSVDALQESLGFGSYPFVEAVASGGQGVVETFKLVSKLTFVDLLRRLQRSGGLESDVFSLPSSPASEVGEATVARRGPPSKASSFASDRRPAPPAALAERDQPFETDPAWVPPVESDVFAVSAPPPLAVPGPEPFADVPEVPPAPAPAPESVVSGADLVEAAEVPLEGPATVAIPAPDPALVEAVERHGALLAELKASFEARVAAMQSAFETRTTEMRSSLDAQHAALEAQRTALESQRAELTRLLEETRATLVPREDHEALSTDLQSLRAAADAFREELRTMRPELGGHVEGLASQLNDRLAAVGADVFTAREETARARAELSDAQRALAEKLDTLAAEAGGGRLAEALRPHEEARAELQRRLESAEQELLRTRAVTEESHRLIDERLGTAERRTRSLAEALRRALEGLGE